MKVWILKAILQKLISYLPAANRINHLFQRYITKGVVLSDAYFEDKLRHLQDHLKYFKKHGGNTTDFKVVELGTGWYPVVPVGMFICGAKEVITIDVSALLRAEYIKLCLLKFIYYRNSGKLPGCFKKADQERWNILEDIAKEFEQRPLIENLKLMNILPKITDARNTGIETEQVDLVVSNNTLEHIYPAILKDILKEFQRILKPGGIMSHFIDMTDHFSHLDKSITNYNFLRYSDKAWSLIDNSLQPQNRLRINDYIQLYHEAGIYIQEKIDTKGNIDQLKNISLDKKYTAAAIEDIVVTHSLIISKKLHM